MRPPLQVSTEFGKAVRMLRLEKGLSQQQLADACGLDLSYIGQIERGKRNPTLGVMHGIAKVLKTKVSDLLKMANL
jgi:transcriptional regulator with XRE-family HTH domain